MSENFQVNIVGKETVPKRHRFSRWNFLKDMLETLHPGQAIRIILPEGVPKSGVEQAWRKFASAAGYRGKMVSEHKLDKSATIYLWYVSK